MADASRPAATRRWRWLRGMLPRGYRERHADDLLATHVELAGGASRAYGARFWSTLAWDVLTTAVGARLDAWSGPVRSGMAPRRRASRSGVWVGCASRAVRRLLRAPGFSVAAISILALGIAGNVTIFRVLDRLILSPPEHIESPGDVKRVTVFGRAPFSGEVGHSAALSYPDYRGLTEVRSFDAVAGYSGRSLTLEIDGVGEGVQAEFATASYFTLLGVRPALGRFYGPEEDVVAAESPVAVLSWSYWRRRFGADPDVLGRVLPIGKARYTVIGVAPRGFTGVDLRGVDVWVPMHAAAAVESGGTGWLEAPTWYMMAAVARVGAAAERAESEATLIRQRVRANARGTDPDARVVLTPLIAARGPNPSSESRVATTLAVLTALVLLITCSNVGNLYLARVLARRRELAIQVALGVSRGRLFAELVLEVVAVALLAGVAAWWIGRAAAEGLFRVLLPEATPATSNGVRVFGITIALALVTALLTGVLPALRATRVDALDVLRRGTATLRVRYLRRGLLLLQAALSVVLLIGAGLFIRSLQRAGDVDLGLDTSVLTIGVELEGGTTFGERLSAAVTDILPRVRESPLVDRAAATSLPPFSGWWGLSVFAPDGDSIPSSAEGPHVFGVSGDYFEAIGQRIVEGRPLRDADAAPGAAPVVVLGQRLASRLWPGEGAIGRCIRTERSGGAEACITVVGVVADFLSSVAEETPRLVYYVPHGHPAVDAIPASALIVRPRAGVTPAMVRDFVRSSWPELRRVEVAPLHDRIAPELRAWRLGATLLTIVGALALLVSAAGLYSILAFDIAQRRREFGIRAALGASARSLVGSAVSVSFATVGLGVAIGLGASLAGGRAIEALLFRVGGRDAAVYAAVCGVMLAISLVAAVVPARRVTRTDPAVPLREE